MTNFDFQEDVLIEEVVTIDQAELIVYNDDYNTFEWVIDCFIEILNHTLEQSEQLSYIIHHTGKASVKVGSFATLKPLKDALTDKGLSAVIE